MSEDYIKRQEATKLEAARAQEEREKRAARELEAKKAQEARELENLRASGKAIVTTIIILVAVEFLISLILSIIEGRSSQNSWLLMSMLVWMRTGKPWIKYVWTGSAVLTTLVLIAIMVLLYLTPIGMLWVAYSILFNWTVCVLLFTHKGMIAYMEAQHQATLDAKEAKRQAKLARRS